MRNKAVQWVAQLERGQQKRGAVYLNKGEVALALDKS
jgi:hypothetical protein